MLQTKYAWTWNCSFKKEDLNDFCMHVYGEVDWQFFVFTLSAIKKKRFISFLYRKFCWPVNNIVRKFALK
jgi:hypothetical protein